MATSSEEFSERGPVPHQNCEFDSITHIYKINGGIVPNVTRVLADLIPGYRASDWYLQRGRAVHACAAMVAKGIAFEHDPRISGQIEAVRRFFREIKPRVIVVERPVYSHRYLYAGTPDLVCELNERLIIPDYKAQITKATIYQCAAYALACNEYPRDEMFDAEVRYGVGIELHEDGTYKMSEIWDLKRPQQEWLALLTTYRVRERLGCLKEEELDGPQ